MVLYKTKIRVSPFGVSYMLGETGPLHTEEYFLKTWKLFKDPYGNWKAQSITTGTIWDVEFFENDGITPAPCPCESCEHEFDITHLKWGISKVCRKCNFNEVEDIPLWWEKQPNRAEFKTWQAIHQWIEEHNYGRWPDHFSPLQKFEISMKTESLEGKVTYYLLAKMHDKSYAMLTIDGKFINECE